jgi:hypothetical protein
MTTRDNGTQMTIQYLGPVEENKKKIVTYQNKGDLFRYQKEIQGLFLKLILEEINSTVNEGKLFKKLY